MGDLVNMWETPVYVLVYIHITLCELVLIIIITYVRRMEHEDATLTNCW